MASSAVLDEILREKDLERQSLMTKRTFLFSILKICVYDVSESGTHVCDVCSACDVCKLCGVCVMCVHMRLCTMDTCFESSLVPSSC